jgi:lauroyl/myristoyl acyltransferase
MLLRAEWRRRIRRFSQRRKNDLIYVLALLGLWLFRRIPLALSIRVGSFLGWVAYCVLRTERARALEHLCIAFPQEKSQRERRRIARRSFQNLGRNAAGRGILKALKRKECLAMLIDQDTKVKGVMVDFFGRKANTPAGPALLACRKPIPVIAGFIHRVTDRSHEIVICPPVEIVRTGNEVQDVEVNTERFNKILENYIRRYPEQWVWMHRRWRRQMPYQGVSARQPADAVSI